jgi:hypothetical protein
LQLPRFAVLAKQTSGKSVAIVGNAESILATQQGTAIDSHDVVLRINRGFVRDPAAQGFRTDIVCLATKINLDEMRRHYPGATAIFVSPYRSNMADDMLAASGNLVCYPISAWQELSERIGGRRPSAGLMAVQIAHGLLAAHSVALFGFDWKATKTFYRDVLRVGVHDWAAERRLTGEWAAEGWLRLPPKA